MRRLLLSLTIAAGCTAVSGAQQDVAQTPSVVTTHHQVTIGTTVLRYTAQAGTIPIRDNETGEAHAHMFFVAYTLDRAPGAPARPLTFLWNGGPGSNSGLVHLLGFGPKRITSATGSMPRYSATGTALVENQETWLTATDLVFVDPVGTGYSRPTKAEYGPEFYQNQGDAESVAEFIRVARLRLDALESPLYLMGESYGVTRASLVADALTRRRTKVAGVILLSGGFPLEGDVPAAVRSALNLPTWTVAAHANRKLDAELQRGSLDGAIRASVAFAEGDYASALARVETLSPAERQGVVAKLARFTGLPASEINATSLRVSMDQVSNALLGNDLMVGHYDSRMIGPRDMTGGPYDPTTDPSLKDILDAPSVLRYLREELGYKSDLFYQGPFGGGYPPPTAFRGDWMSVRWNRGTPAPGGRGNAAPAPPSGLAAALASDPDLRVFVACGHFDMAIPCFASDYAARHVAPSLAKRVTSRIYAGGHATYIDDAARKQLKADVVSFMAPGGRLPASSQQSAIFQEPALATTRHQIRINGAALGYTARVGLIPIRNNDTGEVRGHFGFVSYTINRAPGQPPRPVIFLWNGGPGSDSTTVHFMGFGPRRLGTPDDPVHPVPVEPGLYDNDATWLTFADLVFVDPVGTGYARPSKPEYAAEFYSTLGDIASTAEFIRTFRTRFDLLNAPFFLAGESYGTWRAAGAAELLEKTGVRPAGVLLISGGLAMGQAAPDAIRTALFVPARTATALFHKVLAPELLRDEQSTMADAEKWALDVYAPAWEKRESLSDSDRDRIIAGLAKYTGVPSSAIDRAALAMTSPQFTATLLKDRSATLGRYDMRILQGPGVAGASGASAGSGPSRNQILLRYFRNDLGFRTDLAHQGLESGWSPPGGRASSPGSRWVWNQGEASLASGTDAATRANRAAVGSGDGPPGGSQPWMRRAMTLDPRLKLFVAAGRYDSLNSCADNSWTVSHLDPAVTKNISLGCYAGGHMMYDTKSARLSLRDDVAAFVKASIR